MHVYAVVYIHIDDSYTHVYKLKRKMQNSLMHNPILT